jgi:PAS domain S-box-containing protein
MTLPERNPQVDAAYRDILAHNVRNQALLDFIPDGYLVTDRQGIIQEANQGAVRLLGRRRDFLIGKPLPFFVAAEARVDFYTQLSGLLHRADRIGHWETRLQDAAGESHMVAVTIALFAGWEGQGNGYRWLLRDVTDDRQSQAALRAEKQFSESLVDTVEVFVLVLDMGQRIRLSNRYLHLMTGYDPHEVTGKEWCSLLVPKVDWPQARALIRPPLADETARRADFGLLTREGKCRVVAWTAKSLRGYWTGDQLTVVLGHDMTELHEAQKKALQSERLAAVGQMVAGLAHESRNALQRIQACLSVLQFRFQDQPEAMDLLLRIQKAQDDLHQLFDQVRGYAAPLRLELQLCDLNEVWREAWVNLRPARGARNVELREELDTFDLRCTCSSFHLRQVFYNLFDNALRASSDPVRIVVRCREAQLAGRPAIEIAVCDNGPGFKPENRAKAFEPFFTTSLHGTGLGLAICKRIIEAHEGRITIGEEDQPGGVLLVTLPRRIS